MMFRGLRSETSGSILMFCICIHISVSTFGISGSQIHKLADLKQAISYWSHRPIFKDVDDFDEFDPTPYGGGYDIHLTYGRPIEPSEETCYQISSGGDETVDYNRPNYNSYSEPSAYADEVLDNEYSSYSRPKPSEGRRRPSASGGPGPAYGFQPGMNRDRYGEQEFEEKTEYGGEVEEPPRYERQDEERLRYGGSEEGSGDDDGSDENEEKHHHHQEL